MDDTILAELCAATEFLRADRTWLELLAENIHWSSCESLLQCSLLGAFNRRPSAWLADREKRLKGDFGSFQPDLIVFNRSDYRRWCERGGTSPEWVGMIRGLVQLKMAWTRGNAARSAVITQKAKAIAADAAGLARFSALYPSCRAYLGITVAGFHPSGDGAGAVEEATTLIRNRLQEGRHALLEVTLELLTDVALDYWHSYGRGEDAKLLSAHLVLFRVE